MKKYLIGLLIMFVLNIIFTGLLQSRIKITGNQINSIEHTLAANQTINTFLLRERQELVRRERIVSYAQTNLGMLVLKPDQIADGQYFKEIHEEVTRNNNAIYSFIDFITPTLNAFERK